MTKPHGTDAAGRVVDLIGQPLLPGRGSMPGVIVVRKGTTAMPKAEAHGTYTDANGNRFRIRAGDELPEGATMDSDAAEEPVEEVRDKGAAPENRAKAEKAEKS